MHKIKNYFIGVFKEGKKVRWNHGHEFASQLGTVFSYAIFFGLFLVIMDFLVINLLNLINFA